MSINPKEAQLEIEKECHQKISFTKCRWSQIMGHDLTWFETVQDGQQRLRWSQME